MFPDVLPLNGGEQAALVPLQADAAQFREHLDLHPLRFVDDGDVVMKVYGTEGFAVHLVLIKEK